MLKSKVHNWKHLLVCLFVLASVTHNAEARPRVTGLLEKGSQWTMNVDGEEATLTLLGGKGTQLSKGGFKVSYEIDFGGRKGTLEGVSDAKNTSQRVRIELTRKDGGEVTCQGFVARETGDFMAGTCGDKAAGGAWYAVRRTPAPPVQPVPKKKQIVIEKQEKKLGSDLQLALQQRDQAQEKLVVKINELNRCRKLQVQQGESGKTSLSPFSSFKNRVNGVYEEKGKFDNAQALEFPNAPGGGSKDEKWFFRLNAGLLDIVRLGLGPDIEDFMRLERSGCSGKPVFCEMAYRQQAIYLMLGGK